MSSTMTTASAPGGMGAPVLILITSPDSRKKGRTYKNKSVLNTSVADSDPDPPNSHVFGPHCLVTSFCLFFKNDVNVPSKSNMQKNFF